MEPKSHRVYTRFSQNVVCFRGLIFGLQQTRSSVGVGQAHVEPAPRSHGKARVTVMQGGIKETWVEKKL